MSNQPIAAISSPCIKLCVMEPDSGFCMGCGRTRDEIAGWISYTPEKRTHIMNELAPRLATLTLNKRRKGGRSSRLANKG